MKYILAFLFMLIITSHAMSLGKVYPTRLPDKTSSSYCVVKTISKLPEFANLISDVDNSRRFLELREGINEAKAKHFTFRTMCGTTYVSVFGIK
uniref:Uncharacterized protein n=1 Tax=viral metagenome TaxID=1070528 RepID=A0A6C0DVS2_9ZZZZ